MIRGYMVEDDLVCIYRFGSDSIYDLNEASVLTLRHGRCSRADVVCVSRSGI